MSNIFDTLFIKTVRITNNLDARASIVGSVITKNQYVDFTGDSLLAFKEEYLATGSGLKARIDAGDYTATVTTDVDQESGVDEVSIGVRVKKFTVGIYGVEGCDFNFASAANKTAQNKDIGAVVPAQSIVLGARIKNIAIPNSTHETLTENSVATLTLSGANSGSLITGNILAFDLIVTPISTGVPVTTQISEEFDTDHATTVGAVETAVEAVTGIASLNLSGSNKILTITAAAGYTIQVEPTDEDGYVTGGASQATGTLVYTIPANNMALTLGSASAGTQYCGSTTLSTLGANVGTASLALSIQSSAGNLWLGATPAFANWNLFASGKWEVSLLYAVMD